MPQLDALRAFAVFAVMAHHFVPGSSDVLPFATVGVRLFFVLSGFLITGILLAAKDREQAPRSAMGNFYARRALRIFPLFYVTLAAAAALNVPPIRETWGWHATYLSNAYFFLRGDWHGSASHFWSLAVEEQFYLVWPALVLFTRRSLRPALVLAIIAGPASRLLLAGYKMSIVLPVCCLDTLGMGALLALKKGEAPRWWLPVGVVLFGACQVLRHAAGWDWAVVTFEDLGLAFACGWVVAQAAKGFGGAAGRVLTSRALIYLGTISYGLYVFHNFVPYLLRGWLDSFSVPYGNRPARFLILSGVTVAAASLSWFLLERPLGRLKRHFATGEQPDRPHTAAREPPRPW